MHLLQFIQDGGHADLISHTFVSVSYARKIENSDKEKCKESLI